MRSLSNARLAGEISRRDCIAKAAVVKAWDRSFFDEIEERVEITWENEVGTVCCFCQSQIEIIETLEFIFIEEWNGDFGWDLEKREIVIPESAERFVKDLLNSHTDSKLYFTTCESQAKDLLDRLRQGLIHEGESDHLGWFEATPWTVSQFVQVPQLLHHLRPREFEGLTAAIFRIAGYVTVITPTTRDGGYDIEAIQTDLFGKTTTFIECKRYARGRSVGVATIRALLGVVVARNAEKGILVTTSHFTSDAKKLQAEVPTKLVLIDFEHFPSFISRMI